MKKFASVLTLAAVCLAGGVQAQQLEEWGTAGDWDVLVDPSLGNGCLIQAEYDDGSIVRIGFDQTEDVGYVTVFNQAWEDIEEDAVYPIRFDLDGESYDGEAIGIYLDDMPGVDIVFTSEDFLWDIAKKHTMTLYSDADEVMSIDLEGSYTGLEAVIACQDEMG